MAGGTAIAFTGEGLCNGGQRASATSDAAGSVADLIAAIPVVGTAFGQLPAAAALGTTLTAFRDGHAELAGRCRPRTPSWPAGPPARPAAAIRWCRTPPPRRAPCCRHPESHREPARCRSLPPANDQLLAAAAPNPEAEAADS